MLRDGLRSLAIIAATVAGVAGASLVLAALIVPAAATAEATPTPVPVFDLDVPPTAIGGQLAVSGDRSGTFVLDSAIGNAGYQPAEDGSFVLGQGVTWLTGPEGRIGFEPDTGEVTQVDYADLSGYLDPGDCTVQLGAANAEDGLVSALLACDAIEDIRDRGVISLTGVVAVPASVFRAQSGLPASGGTVDDGGTPLVFDDAVALVSSGLVVDEEERVSVTVHEQAGIEFLGLEIDSDSGEWFLVAFGGRSPDGSDVVQLSEPCPVAVEELGQLNAWTTVRRLTFDCPGVDGPSGSVVADVIDEASLRGTDP